MLDAPSYVRHNTFAYMIWLSRACVNMWALRYLQWIIHACGKTPPAYVAFLKESTDKKSSLPAGKSTFECRACVEAASLPPLECISEGDCGNLMNAPWGLVMPINGQRTNSRWIMHTRVVARYMCTNIYMYICIYTYMYVYIHTCRYIYIIWIYVYVFMYVCVYIQIHVWIKRYVYLYKNTYTAICTYIKKRIWICIYPCNIYIYIYTYNIYKYTHTHAYIYI